MARERTQKKISTRIDRTYFKHLHRWRGTRLALVFIASALAVLFVVFSLTNRPIFGIDIAGERVQNPGHLTGAHTSFENNCAACHDGVDAKGKWNARFSRAVSDAACLKCHDGAIHHDNQATKVMLDKSHIAGARSADCTSCHTEHRGRDALAGTSDLHCTQCHDNLNAGKVKTQLPDNDPRVRVTQFTMAGHPRFGSELMTNPKQPTVMENPTAIRFNHSKHLNNNTLTPTKDHPEITANCEWCHDPKQSAAEGLTWEKGKTAYSLPGGQTLGAPAALEDGTGRHRSLTQVNFARNCKMCHDLGTLPGSDLAIPHADMAVVRQVIVAYTSDHSAPWQKYAPDKTGAKEKPLNDRIIAKLQVPDSFDMTALTAAIKSDPLSAGPDADAKLPAALVAKLQAAAKKLPVTVVPKADQDRVLAAIGATTRPSDHLRSQIVAKLRDEVAKSGGDDKDKLLSEFDQTFARYNQDSPDPRLIAVYVTYANDGGASCIKCHDMQGDAAVVPAEWTQLRLTAQAPAAAPTTQPAGAGATLFTVTVKNADGQVVASAITSALAVPAVGSASTPAVAISVAAKDSNGSVVTTESSTVTISINGGPGKPLTAQALRGAATFGNLMLTAVGPITFNSVDGKVTFTVSVAPLGTKPTGIPAGPRKWFVKSEFEHDAHRSLNCIDCHGSAIKSTMTSDVLSPDIDGMTMLHQPNGSATTVRAALFSCVDCHHAETEKGLGAPDNCTECHAFHDRSKEQSVHAGAAAVLSGKEMPPPTTQPVASASP